MFVYVLRRIKNVRSICASAHRDVTLFAKFTVYSVASIVMYGSSPMSMGWFEANWPQNYVMCGIQKPTELHEERYFLPGLRWTIDEMQMHAHAYT